MENSGSFSASPHAPIQFEPTGQLRTDYIAYCETEGVKEKADILNGILFEEISEAVSDRIRCRLFVRSLDWTLGKAGMSPLASAIPHCYNLVQLRFSSANMTDLPYKLLIQAVWKSPSVISVWVDFNPLGLLKDPSTVATAGDESMDGGQSIALTPANFLPHRTGGCLPRSVLVEDEDKAAGKSKESSAHGSSPTFREVYVVYAPEQGAGGYIPPTLEFETPAKGGKPDKGKPAAPTKKSKAIEEEPPAAVPPIPIPDGFSAILMTKIRDLSLRGNAINDAQVKLLCEALHGNNQLLSVNLWGNSITDVGAEHLARALRFNRTLTSLNVSNNTLTDAAAKAFASALQPVVVHRSMLLEIRSKMKLHISNMLEDDLPNFPYYEDVARVRTGNEKIPVPRRVDPVVTAGTTAAKKDAKPAKGKKPTSNEPGQRVPGAWDEDVIRMTEHLYAVPGNQKLWSLNLSNNMRMTDASCRLFETLLNSVPKTIPSLVEYPDSSKAEGGEQPPVPPTAAPEKSKKEKEKRSNSSVPVEAIQPIEDLPLASWPVYNVGEVGLVNVGLERFVLRNSTMSEKAVESLANAFESFVNIRKKLAPQTAPA